VQQRGGDAIPIRRVSDELALLRRAMQEAGRRLFVVGHGFARGLLSEGAT
jgi:hypothetical protein